VKKENMSISSVQPNLESSSVLQSFRKVWALLDRLYFYCGYLAAFFMVLIFATTMLQIVGRYIGFNPRGLTDYAGYFMGASAFLAFAHTLNRGAHVRIELFLSMLGSHRHIAEKFSFAVSTAVAAWLAYYSWSEVCWSYALGDMSQGLDATPIWIPQSTMALGMTLLAIAVADHGLRLVLTGDHQIETAAEAL
jgi:TRAP-type mannitol/chloroaromatic compound transport system permease small subunit